MTKYSRLLTLTALSILLAAGADAQPAKLITQNSAGKVKVGMTVAQARKAAAPMKLSRTSDGEGIALIAVKEGKVEVMTLYAGEGDRAARVNNNARIEQIWVWDRSYKTANGVHPGMLLRVAEKRYGKVRKIEMSEIESREFAEFASHPKGIDFRLQGKNDQAGVYPSGSSTATAYTPGAYIDSVQVTGRDVGNSVKFSSEYTDLKSGCKTAGGNEGGHSSTFCKGPGGYKIHYFDSASTLEFNSENEDEEFSARLSSESLGYTEKNRKIEWRLANGKPFAVIMRVYEYPAGGEFPKQGKPTGEFLVVKGVKGYESLNERIDAHKTNANEMARKRADGAFSMRAN